MAQSEKNRKFGELLARMFYGSNVRTLPFILNSEQAEAFKQEWRKLEYNTDTSAGHLNNKSYEREKIHDSK